MVAIMGILIVKASYVQFARALRWLTLSLFAYVGTAFLAHPPWGEVLRHAIVPAVTWDRSHRNGFWLNILCGATALVMTAAVVLLLAL